MSISEACALCKEPICSSAVDACPCVCAAVRYCSDDCRLAHWPSHKFECPLNEQTQLRRLTLPSVEESIFLAELLPEKKADEQNDEKIAAMQQLGLLAIQYPKVYLATKESSLQQEQGCLGMATNILSSAYRVPSAGCVVLSEKSWGPQLTWLCQGNSIPDVYSALLADGTHQASKGLTGSDRALQCSKLGNPVAIRFPRLLDDLRASQSPPDPNLWSLAAHCSCNGLRCSSNHEKHGKPMWGLFRLASFVSHSCSPNVWWNSEEQALVSLRPIEQGEQLAVSRFEDFSPRMGLMGSDLRQEALSHSHLILPQCDCNRCASGIDLSRSFFCPLAPCRGIVTPQRGSHAERWKCCSCSELWPAPPAKEQQLCQRAFETAESFRRDPTSVLRKDIFSSLRSLVEEVSSVLGYHHWAYLFVCDMLITFFCTLSSKLRGGGAFAARQQLVSWGRKYFYSATCQEVAIHCSGVIIEEILRIVRALDPDVRFHTEKIKFLRAAARLNSLERPELLRLIGSSRIAVGDDEMTKWLLCDDVDDDGQVLAAWEDFIVNSVIGEMNSKANPAIPSHIRDMLTARERETSS